MSVVKVYLNSKHRLVGSTAEAPEWELVKPVDFVNQFKVRQLIIPNVDYSFTEANRTLIINGHFLHMPTDQRYTSMSSFLVDFNALLASMVTAISGVQSLVATCDYERGKIHITYSSTVPVTINAAERFGLSKDMTGIADSVGVIAFDETMTLVPHQVCLLRCPQLASEDCRSTTENRDVIEAVPFGGTWGDIVTAQVHDDGWVKLREGFNFLNLKMELIDGDGQPIKLHGRHWQIELQFRSFGS